MAENIDVNVNVNTQQAVAAINGLNTTIKGLLAALASREVIQFADNITNLRNKLLQLTPSVDTVNRQFQALVGIALTARTPLESTADLFFRIARSADALGISEKEVATITESLAKAMSASGLSAQEASGPLLQLGQALQSGTFQGDELRSILEGLPPVAKALAQELNVPVGALKKLGSEGQISADIFVKAMRRAKDSIDDAFARTTPTIGSALEGLRTNAKLAFDEFEKNTQTGKNLAAIIQLMGYQMFQLTKSIDSIIGPITTFIQVLVTLLGFFAGFRIFKLVVAAFSSIGSAASAAAAGMQGFVKTVQVVWHYVQRMFGKEVANPKNSILYGLGQSAQFAFAELSKIGALIAGVGTSILAFMGIDFFKNATKDGSEAQKSLEDYKKAIDAMKTGLDDTAPPAQNLVQLQKELSQYAAKQELATKHALENLRNTNVGEQQRLALENEILQAKIDGNAFTEDQIELLKKTQDIDIQRRDAVLALKQNLQNLQQEYSQLATKDGKRAKELAIQIENVKKQIDETHKLYEEHSDGMTDLITRNQNLKSIEEARKKIQEDMLRIIDEQLQKELQLSEVFKSLDNEIRKTNIDLEQMNMSPLEKQISDINIKVNDIAQNAREKFAEAFGEITPANMDEFEAGMKRIDDSADELKAKLLSVASVSRTFEYGWNQAFKTFMDESTNASKIAGDTFSAITSNMNSAIDNFTRTGKFKFKDFARSLIADIMSIQLKASAAKIFGNIGGGGSFLSKLFGFGGGGGFGSGDLFGNMDLGGFFANGGTPPVNRPSIVGERGPELFVPKTNGSVLPNDMLTKQLATGAVNAPVTNNYITNNISAIDAKSVAQLFAENRKALLGTVEMARREMPYGG